MQKAMTGERWMSGSVKAQVGYTGQKGQEMSRGSFISTNLGSQETRGLCLSVVIWGLENLVRGQELENTSLICCPDSPACLSSPGFS